MNDTECVRFLQWGLPGLRMRWPGFRKVRRQVCKRIARRLMSLGLPDTLAYRRYIEMHPDEWEYLDALCRVTVSRFWRDRAVFQYLADRVLPLRAAAAAARGAARIRAWSAGCGTGEEPYSLALLWRFSLQERFPSLEFQLVATDADDEQLERARAACYPLNTLKELPRAWIRAAFQQSNGRYCLRPEFRAGVEFRQQDIRRELPDGPLDLVLCRNMVFTYFEEGLQREIARSLHHLLVPGGVLVVGRHEVLPEDTTGFHRLETPLHLYRRDDPPSDRLDA